MLLDEPTNHLDIEARAALIQALNGYNGCVILVSHDPHLVEAVADQLLLVKDGTVAPYHNDLEAYRRLVIEQRQKERSRDFYASSNPPNRTSPQRIDATASDIPALQFRSISNRVRA